MARESEGVKNGGDDGARIRSGTIQPVSPPAKPLILRSTSSAFVILFDRVSAGCEQNVSAENHFAEFTIIITITTPINIVKSGIPTPTLKWPPWKLLKRERSFKAKKPTQIAPKPRRQQTAEIKPTTTRRHRAYRGTMLLLSLQWWPTSLIKFDPKFSHLVMKNDG